MSVLVAFHCKLERPIRGCDLKVIEKMLLSNDAATVSNGFKSNSALNRYSFRSSFVALIPKKIGGAWGRNDDQCGKNLATMNVRRKMAELYRTEVNQRSS
jgi:hypothetical protein